MSKITQEQLALYVATVVSNGDASVNDVVEYLKSNFNLSEEDLSPLDDRNDLKIHQRVRNAIMRLLRDKITFDRSRGVYYLTDTGDLYLRENAGDETAVSIKYPPIESKSEGSKGINSIYEEKYVYIGTTERDEEEGWFSVGQTYNPSKRASQYNRGTRRRDFHYKFAVRTSKYDDIESAVHEEFENEGEWVKANLNDIIEFIKSKL